MHTKGNKMSWQIINQILGLAAVDKKFARDLLKEPLASIQARGFHLTLEEQRVFSKITASSMNELSQRLMQMLPPDDPTSNC